MATEKTGPGRRPTGRRGEKISQEYTRPTIRLAPSTLAQLRAWSALTGEPLWRLVEQSILEAIDGLPPAQRSLIRTAAKSA